MISSGVLRGYRFDQEGPHTFDGRFRYAPIVAKYLALANLEVTTIVPRRAEYIFRPRLSAVTVDALKSFVIDEDAHQPVIAPEVHSE